MKINLFLNYKIRGNCSVETNAQTTATRKKKDSMYSAESTFSFFTQARQERGTFAPQVESHRKNEDKQIDRKLSNGRIEVIYKNKMKLKVRKWCAVDVQFWFKHHNVRLSCRWRAVGREYEIRQHEQGAKKVRYYREPFIVYEQATPPPPQ